MDFSVRSFCQFGQRNSFWRCLISYLQYRVECIQMARVKSAKDLIEDSHVLSLRNNKLLQGQLSRSRDFELFAESSQPAFLANVYQAVELVVEARFFQLKFVEQRLQIWIEELKILIKLKLITTDQTYDRKLMRYQYRVNFQILSEFSNRRF